MTTSLNEHCMRSLLDAKVAYYLNEQSVLYLAGCLNGIREELVSYNVGDSLEYLLEILNCRALANETLLLLCKEPGFPSEMLGDRNKLEALFMEVLIYLVGNVKNGEIKVTICVRHVDELGRFVIGLDILATRSELVNCEEVKSVLGNRNKNGFCLCETLVSHLKGNMEITEKDGKDIKVAISTPFSGPDYSQQAKIVKLNYYEAVKLDKYTIKWTVKGAVPAPLTESNKSIPEYKNMLSPLLTSRGSEILKKTSVASKRQMAEQNRMRQEVMARIKGGSGPRELDGARKSVVSSFAAGSDPNHAVCANREESKTVPDRALPASSVNGCPPQQFNDYENEEAEEIKRPIESEQVVECGRTKESDLERENEMGESECKYGSV